MCAWRLDRGVGRVALFAAALTLSCQAEPEARRSTSERGAVQFQREPIQPIVSEPVKADRLDLVELGGRLFHEPALSGDGTISCRSCHDLARGGAGNQRVSTGIGGKEGTVNAPTVYNAAFNFVQFWDGRAATLEEQVGGPVTDAREMGGTWAVALRRLREEPSYRDHFARVFPDGVTEANVRAAIAAFERTLTTPKSRFDRWLGGDRNALTPEEHSGYERFKSAGCIACHQGRNVGGNMFQRFGVMGDYFADRGNVTAADYGRYNVTKQESDRYSFRVPSLRNVELTAPYFHDGSAETLEQAVKVMARYQLGRPLPDDDVTRIVSFLKTLTGEVPDVARFESAKTEGTRG
jgi:cytochrome c peroxidase